MKLLNQREDLSNTNYLYIDLVRPQNTMAMLKKPQTELSDEALSVNMMQQLNQGKKVSKVDYPAIDLVRIQNVMAKLEKTIESAALTYDPTDVTLAYRNAEGVRQIHDAFSKATIVGKTEEECRDITRALIQSFLKELGLPVASIEVQLYNNLFAIAKAKAGSLAPVIPSEFPIVVPTLNDPSIREENISEAFQKAFNDTHPDKRFGLILAPNSSPLLRDLLTQPDEGGVRENIVYLDEEDIRTIITSKTLNAKAAFMDFVRRNVSLTIVAPFITEGPTTELMFVGREREISTILQNIESRSYAILGGRRIGKTSMVRQVKIRLQKQGYKVLSLDCSVVSSYQEFYRTICLDWAEEFTNYTPIDDRPITFREMVANFNTSRKSDFPLVFAFDEIDGLLDYDIHQKNPEQLFRIFRDLSEKQKCQFIFSGERLIYEQFRNSSSPMFNFCTPIIPGLLNQKDAQKLIEDPFILLNIPLEGGQTLTDTIVDTCSRHPNLIQWVCGQIVEQLDEMLKLNKMQGLKVTSSLVKDVVSRWEFRTRYMDVFWGQSTPMEKAITLLVPTNEPVEPAHIISLLQQHGFKAGQKQFTKAMDYLILYCILKRDSQGVSFSATHFYGFAEKEISNLQEYIMALRVEYLQRGDV